MRQFIRKYYPEVTGTLLGALGGYLYWRYVGCLSGTCTIKSNWYLMVPWGMVLGYLLGSLAKDIIVKIRSTKKPPSTDN